MNPLWIEGKKKDALWNECWRFREEEITQQFPSFTREQVEEKIHQEIEERPGSIFDNYICKNLCAFEG